MGQENLNLVQIATGSSAPRWVVDHCPGSVAMSLHFEKEEKAYATKGTLNHKECSEILLGEKELIEETDEAIRAYVEEVRQDLSIHALSGINPELHVEERLPLLGSSGQLDAYAVIGKTGFIWDYKDGVHVKRQAQDDEQIAFYACALKEKYPQITSVIAKIIQPRVNDLFDDTPLISSWRLPWQTILAWRRKFEESLKEVVKAEKIKAGPWCQESFCPARGGCPAQLAYAEAAELEQGALPIPKGEWLPESIPRIARILRMRKRINSWFQKAEETLLSLALQGQTIPGFELARKKSNRKVKMFCEEEYIATLEKHGIDPYKKKLISPAQAEEALKKKKQKKTLIADFWEKPEGGQRLKMIEEDDNIEEEESDEEE